VRVSLIVSKLVFGFDCLHCKAPKPMNNFIRRRKSAQVLAELCNACYYLVKIQPDRKRRKNLRKQDLHLSTPPETCVTESRAFAQMCIENYVVWVSIYVT
jgi:hypothetical protein